jgi:hypothetical protein
VDHVADIERADVDGDLQRNISRLGLERQGAQHDAQLSAGDRTLVLADELERNVGDDFLVRIDGDEVDMSDVAADDVDLVVLHQRGEHAWRRSTFDSQIDDGVLLAHGVKGGA